jgi:hypothetical protein
MPQLKQDRHRAATAEVAKILAERREPGLTWWILVQFIGKAVAKFPWVERMHFQIFAKRTAPNLLIQQRKIYL